MCQGREHAVVRDKGMERSSTVMRLIIVLLRHTISRVGYWYGVKSQES